MGAMKISVAATRRMPRMPLTVARVAAAVTLVGTCGGGAVGRGCSWWAAAWWDAPGCPASVDAWSSLARLGSSWEGVSGSGV